MSELDHSKAYWDLRRCLAQAPTDEQLPNVANLQNAAKLAMWKVRTLRALSSAVIVLMEEQRNAEGLPPEYPKPVERSGE